MKLPPLPKVDLKRVRQVRLLPVVIAAACALLLLKGVGIFAGTGYVLTGPLVVQAAGGGSTTPAAEPTLTDETPTLEDTDPTLPLRPEASAEHGAESAGDAATAEGEHGAAAADAEHGAPPAEAEHGAEPATAEAAGDHGPPVEGAPTTEVAQVACPPAGSEPAPQGEGGGHGGEPAAPVAPADCIPAPVDANGDAIPMMKDGSGGLVPMTTAGSESENQILERLAARREELDARESEIDMRMALVDAAEKRIEERTAALEALEARINAMVDEKRTLEESQFVAVVSTYETMKPKDAAAIFDQLEMDVLVRIARAINPRKLAPIMAKMDPVKAKDLTANLAVDQVEPTIEMSDPTLAAELPQIVGQ